MELGSGLLKRRFESVHLGLEVLGKSQNRHGFLLIRVRGKKRLSCDKMQASFKEAGSGGKKGFATITFEGIESVQGGGANERGLEILRFPLLFFPFSAFHSALLKLSHNGRTTIELGRGMGEKFHPQNSLLLTKTS